MKPVLHQDLPRFTIPETRPFYPPALVVAIKRRDPGEAKMHDGSVICLPPPPTPELSSYVPSASAKTAELINAANLVLTEVVFTPDGRFHQMVRLNRKERRSIRQYEPMVGTHDLESAKILIRRHLHADRVSMANVGLTLKQIRDEKLYLQGGFPDLASWLAVEAREIGLSKSYCYRLLAAADTLDRYLILTFMGLWRMSIEDVLKRMNRLPAFLTGIYRHRSLEELKGPFMKEGSAKNFVEFVMGTPTPTPEDDDRNRSSRCQPKNQVEKLKASSGLEQEIVDAVRQHLDVVIVGLNDPKDTHYIKMALLANRREESDKLFKLRKTHFSVSDEMIAGPLILRTLEDAKAMILFHQAEGIPHRLVCAVVCALLADDPELVRQWRALKYENVHTFINIEFDTPFDSYRYVEIGRNYLEYEPIILRHTQIDTDIQFSKLYNLKKALENHGDQRELIWRYFGGDTTVAEWDYFALHRDFEHHFAEKPMSAAQLKKARVLLFNFNEELASGQWSEAQRGPLAGSVPQVFPIVAPHEKRLVELFLRDRQYLLKYIRLYAAYHDQGLL